MYKDPNSRKEGGRKGRGEGGEEGRLKGKSISKSTVYFAGDLGLIPIWWLTTTYDSRPGELTPCFGLVVHRHTGRKKLHMNRR